jgi:two-component system chemotaxis sensor kinase CheA
MAEYLQMFVDETDEQIDELVEVLLVLEREPDSADELNEAFRLVHSIKGAAGMMGFDGITALTHHLENRFEAFRSGLQQLDGPTTSLALRCTDFLRECVRRLRSREPLGSAGELLHELAALDEAPAAEPEPAPETAPETAPEPRILPADGEGLHLTIVFESGLPLVDLKARLILSRLSELGEITSSRPAADALETVEDLERLEISLATEKTPDAIRRAVDIDGVQSIDLEGSAVEAPPAEPEPVEAAPPPAEVEPAPVEPAPAGKPKAAETMRVDLDRLDSLMNLAGELVVNRARFVQVAGQVAPAFRKRNAVSRAREFSASLRRTVEHLQGLAAANGELTRDIEELKAGLALLEEQAELWDSGRRGFARISEAIDQLTRISDSLQQGVLDTRMAPVGPLFSRFKRVVRDLSAQRGKTVNFEIHGEKTELDKRMIDELGDPLVHLVRNSIDHGLETREERLARGKPEAGTIRLEASHSGNNVFIHVRDDGGGIDVARIRSRIVDTGLLSATETDALTDEEAVEYIWHPGFSTAAQVTDVSGRGVGMDAVKTRIHDLNGTIAAETAPGTGTTFTIRLPLTLAIINSLLVRVRDVIFSMPIEDVREIVAVPVAEIVSVHGRHTIDVRGEYIPLIAIDDVFDWNDLADGAAGPAGDGDPVHAVILQAGERAMGLRVDELLGSQDIVIKSLSENFVALRGLSGASILGDGTVCLMLDVGTILDMVIAAARRHRGNAVDTAR